MAIPFNSEYISVVLEEEGVVEVGLGAVLDSMSESDEDARSVIERTDALLSVLAVDPGAWKGKVSARERADLTISGDCFRAMTGTEETAGEELLESTYWSMPMEGELNGEGRASISFEIDDERTLILRGFGVYWRDRFYTHPITGEKVKHRDGQGTELWSHGVEPEWLGYEDGHRMTFTAEVRKVEAVVTSAT